MAELTRHIEVDIHLLPTEKSGRRAPIFTGFQSTFHYVGGEWDVYPIFEQLEFVFPGQSASGFISFRSPLSQQGKIAAGQDFRLRDGSRIIAMGRVTRVLGFQPSIPAAVSLR